MKIQIKNYGFDPLAKTVTFKDSTNYSLESLLLVVNVTTNQVIYNFANPAAGGTLIDNVLTLTYDTTAMNSADKLLIYYDSDLLPASDESTILLRRLVQMLAPIAIQDVNQRQRVTIDAITGGLTLSTMNTLNTVSNIAALGNVDPKYQIIDAARNAFANGIRQNLTFS